MEAAVQPEATCGMRCPPLGGRLSGLSFCTVTSSRKYKQPRTQSTSLPYLWVRRTKPPIVRCLLILVPLVTAFILLFNGYLNVNAQNTHSIVEGLIVVMSGDSGFSPEELRIADELAGAGRVEQIKDITESYLLVPPDGNSFMVYIHSYSDFAPQSPPLEEYEIAADLPEGETALGVYHLERSNHLGEQIEVTLTRIVETGNQDPWKVNVYISDALMQKLMADAPVNILYVYSSAESAKALENALREHMPSAYRVNNFQNGIDVNAKRQEGRLLLMSWIFSSSRDVGSNANHLGSSGGICTELRADAKDSVSGGGVTQTTIKTDPGLAWGRFCGDTAVSDCDSLDQDARKSALHCLRPSALYLRRDCCVYSHYFLAAGEIHTS